MRTILLTTLFIFSFSQGMACDSKIYVPKALTDASKMPLIENTGEYYTLAVNIEYPPIIKTRETISRFIGKKLTFFPGWKPTGEAHITTISPPNFDMFGPKLSKYLSEEDIDQIGVDYRIQEADIKIRGIGSLTGMVAPCKGCDKVESEVYFFIVESEKLFEIREAVLQKFIERGGSKDDFDPDDFYPHITIGYTVGDIHDQPKDMTSLDPRFEIIWK